MVSSTTQHCSVHIRFRFTHTRAARREESSNPHTPSPPRPFQGMTAAHCTPISSAANATQAIELNRARTSSLIQFCTEWLSIPQQQQGPAEDQLFADLFNRGSQGPADVPLNDLPGVLQAAERKVVDQQQVAPTAPTTAQQQAPVSSKPPLHHRAVVTSMPMPATTRAGAAGGASLDAAAADDDTSSQVTMPMPARKRRRSEEEDEACSSPNDLVEVPVAAQTAAARKRHHAAVSAAAAQHQQQQHDAVSRQRDQSAAASAAAAGAAASSPGVKKGILVAKVLTKSDANSKRVILPRIAVETNLPQLTSAPHFHFTATDPEGASWPLVIKAWANGSNPKPVFVMEMIGDVLKQYRLTIGDALALLADEAGRFYLEWNTDAARQAAARPTYSGIVFKSSSNSSNSDSAGGADAAPAAAPASPAAAAAAAAAAGEATPETPTATVAAAVKQESSDQQQQLLSGAPTVEAAAAAGKSPFASAAATAASEPPAAAVPVKQEQQQAEAVPAAPAAPVSASQQQQLFQQLPSSANMPLMTAIPVTSPQVPGTFIPTSPCQLLVVGHLPMPDLDLDLEASLQPSLPSGMLGQLNSCGDVVMPSAAAAAGGCGLATAQSAGDEGLLVPTGAVPQLAHAGGVLLCPRTPGCSRPAGHQGWCLGHKGYKKRRA